MYVFSRTYRLRIWLVVSHDVFDFQKVSHLLSAPILHFEILHLSDIVIVSFYRRLALDFSSNYQFYNGVQIQSMGI